MLPYMGEKNNWLQIGFLTNLFSLLAWLASADVGSGTFSDVQNIITLPFSEGGLR
jgi:hypothetical protein